MTNEFAEVINAQKLTKGFLDDHIIYDGYGVMQKLNRAMIYSLGISEEELADFQMKGIGRDEYESRIEQILGKNNKPLLVALEDTIDTTYNIIEDICNKKKGSISKAELKANLKLQLKNFTEISNKILELRIEKLGKEPDIKEIAKIIRDKEKRDKNLKKAVREYGIAFFRYFKIGLKPNMLEEYGPDLLKTLEGQKRIREVIREIDKEERKNRDMVRYDNKELIEKIFQAVHNYDISKLPISNKEKIVLIMCKKVGELKIFLKNRGKNIKLIPEYASTIVSRQEERETFLSKINESNKSIVTSNNRNNKSNVKIQEEKDDENIR